MKLTTFLGFFIFMTNHNYFVVITAKVLLDKKLTDKQKLLIGLISNLSNERGYCFASNKYLADNLCCSESTIRQHIQELEEADYLGRILKVNTKGEVEFRSLTVLDPPVGKPAPPCRKTGTPPVGKPAHNNKEDNNKEEKDNISSTFVSDGIYPACMELYNNFIIEKTGVGAKIDKATGAALNKIIAYLKTQVKNKENLATEVPNALKYIFTHYDKWDKFHKSHLTLNQIESNFINIINSIKNGKSITKNQPVSKYAPNR